MYRAACLFLFVAFQGVLAESECVPDPVDNITLSLNYTLSWVASTNCDETHYVIYIESAGLDGMKYIYRTDDTYLDVAFLPACEMYQFTIMAYDLHMSSAAFIITVIPAPPGANLTMSAFNVTEVEGGLYMSWEVKYQYADCARYYRVIVWDHESSPRDIYTNYNDILITDLVPCTDYELGVMAIYSLGVEGPVSLQTYQTPAHNLDLPTLRSVRPGTTYLDMTWAMPPYQTNRCRISSISVDGSPYVNLTIPVSDSPARPAIPVHVESLQPDKMYIFRVSVVNTAGPSQPVSIGIQTLPETEVSST